MIIDTRTFRDASFVLFIMQTTEELKLLDKWGVPDSAIKFDDKEHFIQQFKENFGFELENWVKNIIPDNEPLIGTLQLSDGYGEWYLRMPAILHQETSSVC